MRANVGNLLNEVQVISYNGKENFCCFLFLCFHCHESITQGEKNRHWRNLKKNLPLNLSFFFRVSFFCQFSQLKDRHFLSMVKKVVYKHLKFSWFDWTNFLINNKKNWPKKICRYVWFLIYSFTDNFFFEYG